MIFGQKYKHKLPKFPQNVIPTFKKLATACSEEEIPLLRTEVDQTLQHIREEGEENRKIDLNKAEQLAETCNFLLDHYLEFDNADRSLIVGAVRYFSLVDDPLPEEHFATGLDDDSQVLNYVLERLGIEDRYIEI